MFSFYCQNTYKTNKDSKQRTWQLPKMHHMEPKNTTKIKQPKHDQLNPHWTLYYSKCSYNCKPGCHVEHAILLYWGFYSHMLMRGFQCASFRSVLNIGNEAYIYIYMQLLLGKHCTEKLKLLWIGYFNVWGISRLCGHEIFGHYKTLDVCQFWLEGGAPHRKCHGLKFL